MYTLPLLFVWASGDSEIRLIVADLQLDSGGVSYRSSVTVPVHLHLQGKLPLHLIN